MNAKNNMQSEESWLIVMNSSSKSFDGSIEASALTCWNKYVQKCKLTIETSYADLLLFCTGVIEKEREKYYV